MIDEAAIERIRRRVIRRLLQSDNKGGEPTLLLMFVASGQRTIPPTDSSLSESFGNIVMALDRMQRDNEIRFHFMSGQWFLSEGSEPDVNETVREIAKELDSQ